MGIDNYKTEVTVNLQAAWELARKNIKRAQHKQKKQDNRHTRDPTYRVGDQVFEYTPAEKAGPAYKFARPFRGPYCVVNSIEMWLYSRGLTALEEQFCEWLKADL